MARIHVSPDGSNANDGTNGSPLSPRAAIDAAGPGDEVVVHDGQYRFDSKLWITSSGESGNPITMRSAEGASPVFEWTGTNGGDRDSGLKFSGASHWVLRGLELRGSTYKGLVANGGCSNIRWQDLEVHDNMDRGVVVNGADDVTLQSVESYGNYDERGSGEGADGFTVTDQASGLVMDGCRAHDNSDDGFDLWTAAPGATIRNCWAYNNGRGSQGDGNGFKLGGGGNCGGHDVERCVAYGNRSRGFTWNASERPSRVVNCTSVNNDRNFVFRDHGHTLRNNISYGGSDSITSVVDDRHNSWNVGISDPGFRSLDPSSDNFLRLAESSPCCDAGVDVGLSYSGDAPDLGAFEFAGETGSTTERITVEGETVLPAGEAEWNGGSKYQQEHAGFNDGGYVNFEPDEGAYAQWTLDVPSAGRYNFEIRYANGGSVDRTTNLTFAGDFQQVTFPQTGAWTNWDTVTGTVSLPSGAVDLAVETTGQDSGNVDQITLRPVESDNSDGSGAEPSGDTPNHGYNVPEAGQTDWHVALNDNFEAIDRDVPVVDQDGAREQYTPAEGSLYIATDTGVMYVGDGSQWNRLGALQ